MSVYALGPYGCTSDTARLEIIVGLSSAIDSWNTKTLIYPVPVKDILRIQVDFELGKLEVMDFTGRMVLVSKDKLIDLSDLKSGIYLIQIRDCEDRVKVTRKIVKE